MNPWSNQAATAVIDAHIHLDLYAEPDRKALLQSLNTASGADAACHVAGLIAVSMHEDSCRCNLELQRHFPHLIYPAFGFHPEQPLPGPSELERLFAWIRDHRHVAVAIGEVGLPYYTRTEARQQGRLFDHAPYVALLERFVQLAAELDKPVVLHAVYEDARIACDLLEKHGVMRAHFHWFKGDVEVIDRMIRNGYAISVTPDVLYEPEIAQLVAAYPLDLIMTETDGPWPFEGPFSGRITHPRMIASTIRRIAAIKQQPEQETAEILYRNACKFYQLPL